MYIGICCAAGPSVKAACDSFIPLVDEFETTIEREASLPQAEFDGIVDRYYAALDAISELQPATLEDAIALGLVAKYIEHGFPDGGLPGDLALRAIDTVIRLHGGSPRVVGNL